MLRDCTNKNLEKMRRIVVKRIYRSNLPWEVKIIAKYMPIKIKVVNCFKHLWEGQAYINKERQNAYIHLGKEFVKEYSFKRILETFAHEFAHILDGYMRRSNLSEKRWHDIHWQRLNWICGGDTHNYPYKQTLKRKRK